MISIREVVQKQRYFFQNNLTKDLKFRAEQLKKLRKAILDHEEEILAALAQDLNKSAFEAYMTEIGIVLEEIRYILKRFKSWAKPKKVKTPLAQFPAKSKIYSEPYGVVLIMSPWNYPFQLTIAPLVGAIAAGNCALVKPSNYSPKTSEAIAKLIEKTFEPEYITVVLGGREANQDLLKQQFDYIFFTGGPTVGRLVMEAAAKHLTPISLELGGKSPCIVDESANIKLAAKRIIWGKFINAGQTCVAPDYVFVQKNVKEKLLEYMVKYIEKFFSEALREEYRFPKIVNERHFNRLLGLMESGKIYYGGKSDSKLNRIEPTILDNVSWDSPIMQEEIFGPLLPILDFSDLNEVINKVNSRPKPLALYFFTTFKVKEKTILTSISHGGGCINDTIVHLATPYLPFGGVGESGIGNYHGKASFDTFSHKKSIMKKSNLIDIPFRYPPFKNLKLLKKFMK
ncbi:MAG TPA: aldehyde dehydrogenase [Acholeplasmataceae bacterium]|nr:aldehyde dehydrogenase [Acholeplasmataceae bacterium]